MTSDELSTGHWCDDACVFQYADDTQLLVSGPKNNVRGLISRMEASLETLNKWFHSNALKVNASKTQLMIFGSRQNLKHLPPVVVSFRDAELEPCAQAGNLGVVFDSSLTWEAHVTELSRRCMGLLIGLSHVRHCLPDGVIKTIVTALVISRVNYCLSVYGNGTKKNLNRLQKILNFATRVIFGRRKFDHVTDLREKLNWMPPEYMYKLQTMATAHKAIHYGEPVALASMFTKNRDSSTRDRNTRQDNLLQLQRPRLETGKRRFSYRAAALLNDLPPDLSQLPPSKFARAVKSLWKNDRPS